MESPGALRASAANAGVVIGFEISGRSHGGDRSVYMTLHRPSTFPDYGLCRPATVTPLFDAQPMLLRRLVNPCGSVHGLWWPLPVEVTAAHPAHLELPLAA